MAINKQKYLLQVRFRNAMSILLMSLSPNSYQIKIKQLRFLDILSVSLSKYSSRHPLPSCYQSIPFNYSDPLLKRLKATKVYSFTKEHNKLLQAFSFLLLKCIYGQVLNQNLLNLIKLQLYSDSLLLTNIKGQPLQDLESDQMKKIVVQFIFELCFTNFNTVLEKRLQKYPVVICILSIFLRAILVKLGVPESNQYTANMENQRVIQLLSDFFDLNYRKCQGLYLFLENNLFMLESNQSQILVGRYCQHQTLNSQSTGQEISSVLTPTTGQNKVNSSRTGDPRNILFNSSMPQLQNQEGNAPTPSFGEEQTKVHQQPSLFHFNVQSNKNSSRNGVNKHPNWTERTIYEEQIQSNFYHMTSPSVASIEQKLQIMRTPVSDRCGYELQQQRHYNRFDLTVTINEEFFFEANPQQSCRYSQQDLQREVEGVLQGSQYCLCKEFTKFNLQLYPQVYSLKILASKSYYKPIVPSPLSKNFRKRPPFVSKGIFKGNQAKTIPQRYQLEENANRNTHRTKLKTEQSDETDQSYPSFLSYEPNQSRPFLVSTDVHQVKY